MLPYYLCAAFTINSAGVSLGFSVAAYQTATPESAALTNAKHDISRSLAIFLVSLGLLFFPANAYLISLALIMIVIHLFDGIIGIKISPLKRGARL